ncbi:MAG TPA: hypothetical protein VKY74_08605 [Chloroflexia bacterium]|nr:hypothetical protein [Chloroflexia bacterium]
MTLILPLLFTFLLAGQLVRRWNRTVIALLAFWIALVVGVNAFLLK